MPKNNYYQTQSDRPIQPAIRLQSKEDLKGDLILAGICLAGFLFGLAVNIFTNFWDFVEASERGINNRLTSVFLQVFVYFGFPLFLVAAGYFLWHAWRQRKITRRFQLQSVRTGGQITHLWKEPPSGSGKKYFVGYSYAGNQSAFAQVDVRRYKRLQIGEALEIVYLPEQPEISHPDWKTTPKKGLNPQPPSS